MRIKVWIGKFESSDDDMQYYSGMENYAQFKALHDFLDGAVKACSRLNYWGSNNSNLQLDSLEKRGKKRTLLPIDELFLTMARLRVNLPERFFLTGIKSVSVRCLGYLSHGSISCSPDLCSYQSGYQRKQ